LNILLLLGYSFAFTRQNLLDLVLVSGLRLARKENGSIVLSGVQPQAQVVFQLTMLDRIFTIQPTVEEARQSLV